VNEFDELIGGDVTGEERERLLGVHELLVHAGPPPELPAGLRDVRRPAEARERRRPSAFRTVALLAAALIVVGLAFSAGFATGHRSSASPVAQLALKGTTAAPRARATLDILAADKAGNWPMALHATGLKPGTIYEVYLVRDGKRWGSCGSFLVNASGAASDLRLNAPYRLEHGDTWIVTRETPAGGAGETVLKPAPVRA
jgi:hypothetical protein